jgi:ribosomal 30S subunit maturation factor RimM
MTIEEIALQLVKKNTCGFEITKRRGVLTSTWLIYKKKDYYYYFDINERIIFDENHKYSLGELIEEFQNSHYDIDCEIG